MAELDSRSIGTPACAWASSWRCRCTALVTSTSSPRCRRVLPELHRNLIYHPTLCSQCTGAGPARYSTGQPNPNGRWEPPEAPESQRRCQWDADNTKVVTDHWHHSFTKFPDRRCGKPRHRRPRQYGQAAVIGPESPGPAFRSVARVHARYVRWCTPTHLQTGPNQDPMQPTRLPTACASFY